MLDGFNKTLDNTSREFFSGFESLTPFLIDRSLDIVAAILILLIGIWLSGKAWKFTYSAFSRTPHIDSTLRGFFASIARYVVLIVTVLAVLAKFGVQTASLIAVIGAAGLAIGLALQGTLSNVAAGVMLLILRPFRVGQYVEIGGIAGTVRELTLFNTELATPDNVQILIPNSQVWGQPIRNFTFHGTRRIDAIFGISYEDDIGKAIEAIKKAITADPRYLATPEPFIAVWALNQSSVDIRVEVWANTADFGPAKFGLNRAVKEAFDQAGVTIPYPTQTSYTVNIDGKKETE